MEFKERIFETRPELEPRPNDTRLSKEEALVYQDYATNLERISFSDEAREESYNEADQLIKILKKKL